VHNKKILKLKRDPYRFSEIACAKFTAYSPSFWEVRSNGESNENNFVMSEESRVEYFEILAVFQKLYACT